MKKTFLFKEYGINIRQSYYVNGRIKLDFIDIEDGLGIVTATVNIPDYFFLEKNQVLIKDYSENKGVYKLLLEHEIISPIKAIVQIPYGNAAFKCDFYKDKI